MSDTHFRNKYRIASHRRPNWDYASDAMYFITMVTQNRECNLGRISAAGPIDSAGPVHTDGRFPAVDTHGRAYLQLSDFGIIVNEQWLKSFDIRNELFLDEYIIMPNHLHAIVVIDNPAGDPPAAGNGIAGNGAAIAGDGAGIVQTHGRASLPRSPKSISSFMAGFKSAVNSKIDDYIDHHKLPIPKYNRHNHFFQPNYHDHIIRNETEYVRIKQYIINNPSKWVGDTFNGNR
ncbi:MAG: hypothetical protein QM726_10010 [Chitinophagaceae bacterium]